jgi:hypothetical protein
LAIEVHFVGIELVRVDQNGQIYHTSTSQKSIKDSLNFTTEHRITPDLDIPNSANYPTIKEYLNLEGAQDFEPVQIGQSFIITMRRSGGST